MELFERVEKERYSWTLFYYLQQANYNDDMRIIHNEFENGVTVDREVVSGVGLEYNDWDEKFDACKKLQVFESELELSLLCSDKEMNLYSSKGRDLDIRNIDIIGSYIYATDKEICTPVQLVDVYTDNFFFDNFKEYQRTGKTSVSGLTFLYEEETLTFSITLNDENGERVIYKMSGGKKKLSYVFVVFALKYLPRGENYMQGKYNVERIRRRRYDL